MEEKFTKNLDDLLYLSSQKNNLVLYLKKNYSENIHYIKIKKQPIVKLTPRGGHNKDTYLLTEKVFELIKNSFNIRNKYIVNIADNIHHINAFSMCIENQTIGFIENSYHGILSTKRQHIIGKYRVDLYFINYKLVIECDENNHSDRNAIDEKTREDYIVSQGNKIIRFNPNEPQFDLSNVLKQINKYLFNTIP